MPRLGRRCCRCRFAPLLSSSVAAAEEEEPPMGGEIDERRSSIGVAFFRFRVRKLPIGRPVLATTEEFWCCGLWTLLNMSPKFNVGTAAGRFSKGGGQLQIFELYISASCAAHRVAAVNRVAKVIDIKVKH